MITIYTKENCDFCIQAKIIMKNRNISFVEKKLGLDFVREDVVRDFPTMKTYPIIVNDGVVIGGFNEFVTELHSGKPFQQLLKE